MFPSLPDGESLDNVEAKRIRLDASIHEDPLPVAEFANSVVIFDDIDVISETNIRDAVYNILWRRGGTTRSPAS